MCMNRAIRKNLENQDKIAYKTMKWSDSKKEWITPFMEISIKDNKLTADGAPDFVDDFYYGNETLNGGAIHCYTRRNAFHDYQSVPCAEIEKTFKVSGKNVIAYNNKEEIAFDEIEFLEPLDPPTEEERQEFLNNLPHNKYS